MHIIEHTFKSFNKVSAIFEPVAVPHRFILLRVLRASHTVPLEDSPENFQLDLPANISLS